MDKIEKFLNLFSDFELVVVPKIEKKREVEKVSQNPHKTKAGIKKALKRLEQEYKQAMKAFRANKISKNELYDFEWRIFELQEELKKIDSQDTNY